MKLFKLFIALIAMIVMLMFLMRNSDVVDVDLIYKKFADVEVAFIMIGSFSVGLFIGFGLAVANILSAKSELKSMRTKNKRLSDELNELRNVAIDEGIYDQDEGES